MGQDYMEKCKEFLKQKKRKRMKKSDWLILVLAGVLLMILGIPVKKETGVGEIPEKKEETVEEETQETHYAGELEERLEKVLEKMEGVGEVKVMITLADYGEEVVEKDSVRTESTTTETDGSGGNRTITESEVSDATVYVEKNGESVPSLKKESTPKIEGVVVVAEGGDRPEVISNISDTAMALFPVEAHKVKVVKMTKQEDVK